MDPLESSAESSNSSVESSVELEAQAAEAKVPLSTSMVLPKRDEENKEDPLKELLEPRSDKVTLRFHPIGSAPGINPSIFKISGSQTVATVSSYLMKRLRLKHIHLYVSSTFQPNPDEKLGDLHDLFSSNGELVLGYCETIAFG
ncbi:hypothetical protein FT663_00546 [Candidozyma haemuli var. vulneris]|uniref:Ubiquitin-like protein ATG12 n=1 Tax=Candidozyma haemuli TaxID=45357 RepID=A0A2V1B094_9ASCO|nr:hypothetical protein CXQ85_004020 [[Candida] haemuloni]KAF3993272.1 hypothetical protein FT662_00652 [[Candida] haemuloni var. vulneris]KAF3995328.1 hypothetical protein FT663_00546 [[Candida] haemuloni var. vulneris]PVH23727.1 hypothetical protein CXQ85_004020 [[Candida] haemuloni]